MSDKLVTNEMIAQGLLVDLILGSTPRRELSVCFFYLERALLGTSKGPLFLETLRPWRLK